MRKNLQHIQLKYSDHWGEVKNLENLEHLDFGAGFPPFLRGNTTTMYLNKSFEIHQNLMCLQEISPDSGSQLNEVIASASFELAHILLKGLEKVKSELKVGNEIDLIMPQFSVSIGLGMNHFVGIAKFRAARLIWAKLIQQFDPKDPKSMALQIFCQTNENMLINNEAYESVTRICVESVAGFLGGTQSIQLMDFDKSVKKSDDFLSNISHNIELYLLEETKMNKTIDPWGGSYFVETLTHELAQSTWKFIEEIEELGGIFIAFEKGIFNFPNEEGAS